MSVSKNADLRFAILISASIGFLWLIGIDELGIRRYGSPELMVYNDDSTL